MSEPPDPKKIRVFYVEKSPLNRAFTRLLSANYPDIDLTTTDQPHERLNILWGGVDGLIIVEKKPFIGGKHIARIVRSRGFTDLLIVIRRKTGGASVKGVKRVEKAVFFDGERDVECQEARGDAEEPRRETPPESRKG